MIFLGIDPGTVTAGYSIARKEYGKTTLLDYGALCMKSSQPLAERVAQFHDFFKEKIEKHAITHLAIETPFAGKNMQNFLKLGYLRGIIYLLSHQYKLTLIEYAPQEIKRAVAGHGRADKDEIARILTRLLPNLIVPTQRDITDALAVTLCAVWKTSSPIPR